MIDEIATVTVSNGGARCGCVVVPESRLFDANLNYSDRGIYAVVAATCENAPLHWNKFCSGAPKSRCIDALRRLSNAGYLSAMVLEGSLNILIRNVQAYSQVKHKADDIISIHGVKKPAPINGKPHIANYKTFNVSDPEHCPVNISQELWDEWIEYRKDNGHSVRKAHCGRMKAFIESLKKDGAESVQSSINNGYKGLFPLRGSAPSSRSKQILGDVETQTFEDEI